MIQTLDQTRAAFAWECASRGVAASDYKPLAKGAPSLIMNSGLMSTLAFYKSKASRSKGAKYLLEDLIRGTLERLGPAGATSDFRGFMQRLHGMPSSEYLRYTDEALELLKWIRQFVDAVDGL